MPDTEYELVRGALASGVDSVDRLERFADETQTVDDCEHFGIDADDDDGLYNYGAALDAAALEIVTMTETAWGYDTPAVVGVRVVFGTGGPHVEATYRHNGVATVNAYWGGQSAEQTMYAPETCRTLIDIAEEGLSL